jgi:hypothetical protein
MNKELIEALDSFQVVREQLDVGLFVSALFASLLAAIFASFLYRFFYERRGTGSQVHRAFPLLAISITTLFIGVQISIPLSLGLLGALSIIRFRTPIKEPEEVGFIMLVIASSIAAATFNFAFLFLLNVFAIITLICMRGTTSIKWLKRDGMMVIIFETPEATAKYKLVEEVIKENFGRYQLESTAVRNGQTSYQYVFSNLKCSVDELQNELMKKAKFIAINVYLDKPGGIR